MDAYRMGGAYFVAAEASDAAPIAVPWRLPLAAGAPSNCFWVYRANVDTASAADAACTVDNRSSNGEVFDGPAKAPA